MIDAASDQIARAIGRRLPPGWNNEGKIGNHSETSATMSTERQEQVTTFLNRKENEFGGCQTRKESNESCVEPHDANNAHVQTQLEKYVMISRREHQT